jgi:MFS transporter, AAHS family, 4-hydroxybenzoate transporter
VRAGHPGAALPNDAVKPMAQIVDVAQILDEQRTSWTHIRIVVLCFLMLFLDGIDNLGMAYVAPALSQAWHLGRGALGPVFTAGVAGNAIGALLIGPLADRFGRKSTTIITVVYFAVLTLAVTQASDLTELMVLRFMAGLGLGSLVPMAVVIASEFAPRHTRARLVTLAACGYAIGAASSGLIAAQVVPAYGWQGMFYLGGVVPLLLAAAMYFWLPESVRLLALRPGTRDRIARTLRDINSDLSFADDVTFTVSQERTEKAPRVFQLFTEGRVPITLLLWFIIFLNTTVLNLLNSWLPTLVNSIGLPQIVALRVASSLQFGGLVGVISMGMLADRFGFFRVLAAGFFVAAIFVGLIGSAGAVAAALAATIAVAGFCNIGCQITNAAMAATLYPTDIRSTGVNWAHGVARILSTVGPLLGGILLEYEWPLRDIFMLFSVPLFIACGSILVLQSVVHARDKARSSALPAGQSAVA